MRGKDCLILSSTFSALFGRLQEEGALSSSILSWSPNLWHEKAASFQKESPKTPVKDKAILSSRMERKGNSNRGQVGPGKANSTHTHILTWPHKLTRSATHSLTFKHSDTSKHTQSWTLKLTHRYSLHTFKHALTHSPYKHPNTHSHPGGHIACSRPLF